MFLPLHVLLVLATVTSGGAAMAKPGVGSMDTDGVPGSVDGHRTADALTEVVAVEEAIEVDVEVEIEVESDSVLAVDSPEQRAWAGTVEVYGFAPLRTSIETDIGRVSASDSLSLQTLLENLESMVSFRGSVEYHRIGLLTDISYVSVGENRTDSFSRSGPAGMVPATVERRAGISFDQGIYDLALRYRFGERERAVANRGDYTLIPYAGIRVLDVTSNVTIDVETSRGRQREFKGSAGSTIVQPLIGLQGQVFVTPSLRLFARGDLGGLNLGSNDNLSANAQIGIGYAVGNSTQLNLSWRYLYLQQDQGGSISRSVDIRQNGIELGLKFFF